MNVRHRDENGKGIFFVESDTKIVAEMTYVWPGEDTIRIDHTQVNPALKGQGVGKLLITSAVEFARKKGLKIIPACSFAKHVFEEEITFKDVLQTT